MNQNRAYKKISLFEEEELEEEAVVLTPVPPTEEDPEPEVTYTVADYRHYIEENFMKGSDQYIDDVLFNIIMQKHYTGGWTKDYKSVVPPAEQLEYFSTLYKTKCFHFCNDYITVFSIRYEYENAPEEFAIFVKIADMDVIIEFPTITSLNEEITAPACAINFYDQDGVMIAGMPQFTEAEKEKWQLYLKCKGAPKAPKDHAEWYRDKREYYFFYFMELHKWGRSGRVSELSYDTFCNYSFTLGALTQYFSRYN